MVAEIGPCILCRAVDGQGKWQVCPDCRRKLIENSARRQATMRPTYCVGCNRLRPIAGEVYCPRCKRRFSFAR